MKHQQPAVQASDKAQQKRPPVSQQETLGSGLADGILRLESIGSGESPATRGRATVLSDPRLQIVQRQRLATEIGQKQGNGHLQRVVAFAQQNRAAATAEPASTHPPLKGVQTGNASASPRSDRKSVVNKSAEPSPTSKETEGVSNGGAASSPALSHRNLARTQPTAPEPARIVMRQGAARGLQETAVLPVQQQYGNHTLQRLIQRDTDLITTIPDTINTPSAPLPTFDFEEKADTRKDQPFESVYRPVGPVPQTGDLDIYLWVHITYRNFSLKLLKNHEFDTEEIKKWKPTDEQKRDFEWQADEKESFELGFMKSVQADWSEKHTLVLRAPQFSEYRARVNVNVVSVSDPKLANVKITAQKMPEDAPRIRSFVKDGKAVLDIRDPDVEEDRIVPDVRYVRQVGPFDFDSDKVNEIVDLQLKLVKLDVGEIERKRPETDRVLFLMGRASAKGDKAYNEDLGMRRANTVETRLRSDMGAELPKEVKKLSFGESNASNDPKFQRVDVSLIKVNDRDKATTRDTKQNVAAHEAGHMFGLGDEYREEVPSSKGDEARFLGDEPSHYQDVRDTLGFEAADDLLVKDSGSIMAFGGDVKAGHYVYFIQALNVITGKQWEVEK